MLISSLINRFSTKVDKLQKPQKQAYGFKMRPVLGADTFERSSSLPKLKVAECTGVYYGKEYKELVDQCEKLHEKRLAKYGTNDDLPEPENATKNKYKAVQWIQEELGSYYEISNKLKKGIPLNSKEKSEFNFILSQMEKAEEDRTLWRLVVPYDGFVEQINSGKLDLNLLNSTNAKYDGFMGWWNHPGKIGNADGVSKFCAPVILKINVKKGTKLLDCNIKHGKDFVRMRSEVVLPPSKARVDNIDNDLGVVELTVTESMQ